MHRAGLKVFLLRPLVGGQGMISLFFLAEVFDRLACKGAFVRVGADVKARIAAVHLQRQLLAVGHGQAAIFHAMIRTVRGWDYRLRHIVSPWVRKNGRIPQWDVPIGVVVVKTCDTFRMTETKRDFQVIEGTPEEVDWVHLLEELDAREALPILRSMSRQRKPAANSALALVEPDSTAAPDSAAQSTNVPA